MSIRDQLLVDVRLAQTVEHHGGVPCRIHFPNLVEQRVNLAVKLVIVGILLECVPAVEQRKRVFPARRVQLDELTPREALEALYRLKGLL